MEAIYSSETLVDFQGTTRRYIPENSTLHNHRCESLKSYITLSCSRPFVTFYNTGYFEVLQSIPGLEDHLLSAVRDYCLNTVSATAHAQATTASSQ
jgi:hypothetical protein